RAKISANPVSRFATPYYIRSCYVRSAADAFSNLTFGHYAPAAFDPIPPYFGFFVFLSVGRDPRPVQYFAAEQLQQSVSRYRRAVAAEHPRTRRSQQLHVGFSGDRRQQPAVVGAIPDNCNRKGDGAIGSLDCTSRA